MLVLSRKKGERIQVGDDVTITVVEVCGGNVRIGIDAPLEVNIVRTELTQQDREVEGDECSDQD